MALKYTQYMLLKNGLMAFPVLTTMIGAMVGYFLSNAHELDGEAVAVAKRFAQDVGLGAIMGLLAGVVISCFAQAGLACVKVLEDPKYREKMKGTNAVGGQSLITKVYEKQDLEDHTRSTTKTQTKYKEKADAEKVERTQILEMGTKGIEEQRKAALGIKSSAPNKSAVNQPGKKSVIKK